VPWSGAPDNVRCTRTVQLQTRHPRVSLGVLCYNSPDCPVHQRSNGSFAQRSTAKAEDSEEQCAIVHGRAEPPIRGAPDSEQCLSGAASDCPVPLEDKASNGRQRPNPNGWVTWLAHRTVSGGALDCPVRPSTSATPNGYVVVEGYKYPPPTTTTPSIQVSNTSHSIQELVHSLLYTIQKNQSLSKSQIHYKHLVTRECFVRVLCALVLGSLSSSTFLFSSDL
jgi:hypothetical protein